LVYLDDLLADNPGADRRAKVEAGLKKSRLANRPLSAFVDDAEQASRASGWGDANVWVWILLAVLAVAVAEPTLANRISALLFARPRTAPTAVGPS
jgi:anti-sigma-K factor RskA